MGTQPQPPANTGLDENMACALCYLLGLLTGILFLVLEPHNRNPRVKFHAWQAILMGVGFFALYVALGFLGIVLSFVGIGALALLMYPVLGICMFLLWLFLMYKAYNGENFQLPLIADFAKKQAGFAG